MNSAESLFGCKVVLNCGGGEVMLYVSEHVLLELTMLFDVVVQPQKVWGDVKLVDAEIGFAQRSCHIN